MSVVDLDAIPRIKALTADVASKIAAGEVVERPASVLKELLENSIDAGATKIEVTVTEGGIQNITVVDNGYGILQQDLQLALQQHATSKIQTADDLESIISLGFRGEALASINSVCKLSITSQTAHQDHAWTIAGNNMIAAAHPIGTTIKMQDLFYNIPARRKFLRSPRTEYLYLEEVFRRIALSHFNVGFSLTHNDKTLKNLPPCTDKNGMTRRLMSLCGKQLVQNSVSIDAEQNGMRIWGWLGSVDSARSQEPHQYFFINKRVIKDRLINHAIRQVYQPLTLDGKMPFYCLYLELDPVALDVNVHPTKHEVRFRDSRIIHAFISQVLTDALRAPAAQQAEPLQYQTLISNLQTTPTNIQPIEILGILDQKMILARRQQELLLVDVLRAQQQILLQQLNAEAVIYKLDVPVVVPMMQDLPNDFVQWFAQCGIELAMLGPQKAVIRTLPQALVMQKLDYVALLSKLQILWKQKATLIQVNMLVAENVQFCTISQIDAINIIQQALKLPADNIYRILNVESLQELLQSKNLPSTV